VVYICIPAYNEERTIGVVLWKIRQVMAEFGRDYQVLVVDDGSTDGTGDVMEPYARIMPLHVRRHEHREGYGPSLEALLREAVERAPYVKRDVVVTLQADFTDEPGDIATLVKRIEGGADLVTGRVHFVPEETPRMIRWSRKAWHWLLGRNGDGEGDVLSGFRAYRVIALKKALDSAGDEGLITTDGWASNAELLRKVAPYARRTETVDVEVRYSRLQRESRFRPMEASAELFRLLRSGPPRTAPAPAEAAGALDAPDRAAPKQGRRRGARGPAADSA
jgi:dolichol-phosphate mannosyltransferase